MHSWGLVELLFEAGGCGPRDCEVVKPTAAAWMARWGGHGSEACWAVWWRVCKFLSFGGFLRELAFGAVGWVTSHWGGWAVLAGAGSGDCLAWVLCGGAVRVVEDV